MAKQVKSDGKVRRAMVALFKAIDHHGLENCEKAITAEHLNQCDKKSIIQIRELYVEYAGASAKQELLELIDDFVRRRTRQSPLVNKPTEADLVALYTTPVEPLEPADLPRADLKDIDLDEIVREIEANPSSISAGDELEKLLEGQGWSQEADDTEGEVANG